jgi:hypothetical protein
MTLWFGEPWPTAQFRAPVCENDDERVPAPMPWVRCLFCKEPFPFLARGVVIPHLDDEGLWREHPLHLACLLGNVGAA